MTPRPFRVWLLAIATSSALSLFAQPTGPAPAPEDGMPPQPTQPLPPAPGTGEEMIDSLRLSDAPLELVLQRIEDFTGRTILRPQSLPTPTITININRSIPKSEALLALETLLNLNQIGLTPMGDRFLKVVPLPFARYQSPELVEGSTLNRPASGQIIAKLFQLEFLRVNEFLPQINPLLDPNLGGPVIFEKSNAALITDSVSTIQRIEQLILQLDQPLMSSLTPKFYNVQFAKASDLVNKIRAMLQGPLQMQLGSATTYSADDRTNQVILLSDPRQHEFFDSLIAKLDVKSDPNTRNEVLYLRHAASKEVAALLSQLVSGQTKASQGGNATRPVQPPVPGQPAPAPNPEPTAIALPGMPDLPGSSEFSSLVTVLADERSNAVIVSGTVDDIRLIRELVEKVDILLAQVRIEVVIAEVGIGDSASSGISSLGLVVEGNRLTGIRGAATGLNVGGNVDANGSPTGFAQVVGDVSLAGIVSLSTTPRKNNSTILSVPAITTTHNKEATLFFGETRPVITGTTSSPIATTGQTTSSTVTQQEIGTKVTVKPLIGHDGSVQLAIKQNISDVAGEVELDGNKQYVIGKRETDSFITVKSGEIIVLGGMQKENNTHSTSRLGPIPIIGDILGSRSRNKTRTELVVFVRPTVLTNTPADNDAIMKQMEGMANKEEVREKLDPNYKAPKKPLHQKIMRIP